MLMADGEYIGHLPFRVVAEDCALRVLVPPAVAAREGGFPTGSAQRHCPRWSRSRDRPVRVTRLYWLPSLG